MMDHEGFFREWGRTTVASKRITRPGDNSDAGGSMDIWIETLYQAFKARLNEEESSMSGRITDERLDIVTNVIADGECCDIGHELELLQALKAERDQLKGAENRGLQIGLEHGRKVYRAQKKRIAKLEAQVVELEQKISLMESEVGDD